MADRLNLRPGMRCVDLGCGVGGPMRNIARFSGARITGVNNSAYQIKIATKHNKLAGLEKLCEVVRADFMKQPFPDNTFDGGYQIEATCHAPDLAACFTEAFRVLKPGALMAGYEWLMTKNYDAKNAKHVAIKQGIEQGNGIPNLRTIEECKAALRKAGFEIVDTHDRCPFPLSPQDVPWYGPLAGEYSWENIRSTKGGRYLTSFLTYFLEIVRLAPKGTYKVQDMLTKTADDLVAGGEQGIFTPAYFWLARKPRA
jgi:sterol 24-C-methyltransferase